MDGLLIDSERKSQEILLQAATRVGLSLSAETMLGMVGKNNVDGTKYLESHVGSSARVNDLLLAFVELYEAEVAAGGIPMKSGVLELFSVLDEHKIPRAIATSTHTDLARRKLERLSLLSRVDEVIGGDQVVNGKPAPDIYLKACRAIGHSVETSWACEDSPAGIEAASTAGLRAILVPDLIEPSEKMRSFAWRVVNNLTDVAAIIRTEAEVVVRR